MAISDTPSKEEFEKECLDWMGQLYKDVDDYKNRAAVIRGHLRETKRRISSLQRIISHIDANRLGKAAFRYNNLIKSLNQ